MSCDRLASGGGQNSHSWESAQPPTNNAWLVERAGLTDVLVTGIEIRWISVRVNPMASPAKPAGARESVAPWMTIRKKNVITTSIKNAAPSPNPFGECSP